MPESDVMPPGEAASKSPLDKPLHQLTEDDISQLTREDCRRYLKEKGMRRPSWNKSQAIQQVISLKALLEPSPDSDAGTSKKLYIPRSNTTNNNNAARVPKGTVADAEISESAAEEAAGNRRKDPEKPNLSGDPPPPPPAAAVNNSAPSRLADSADILVGQMTIFYCGQVNVYDDVPADKVQAIMHLAGSPFHVPPDCPARHSVSHLQTANVEVGQDSAVVFLPPMQTVKKSDNSRVHVEDNTPFYEDNPAVEGSGSRKASVQRYLEKRKDRFKNKRKVVMTSPPGLDIYLKHQMQNHSTNEQSDNRERIMEG
ncbi:PREDICTED: protein TIFY 4B-like isoform X1 [Ipomoea nil]|uniref:protein TIFY 4B-like isoform X1 n=2 Tax=Ipomoea nil TaxID=35883 RepID=UPI0009018FA7|nr:PREDICTED: protein TIFY 4B-like isoform X1 [Ipomoea nil]